MMFKLKSFYRYYVKGLYKYLHASMVLKTKSIPVVVYTMAKVGSSSISYSLKKAHSFPVFHLHTIDLNKIKWAFETCREKGWWPDSMGVGSLIYKEKVILKKPINFITVVRDPIERNISAFFEVFRYYVGKNAGAYSDNPNALYQKFFEDLPHEFPLQWLDVELKEFIGIDVYSSLFDTNLKYQTYSKEHIKLLLFRLDMADAEKEKIIMEFLNIKEFSLVNQNVGSKKEYAKLYASFKANLVLPDEYLDKMINSKYCKHFYSDEERRVMFEKWSS